MRRSLLVLALAAAFAAPLHAQAGLPEHCTATSDVRPDRAERRALRAAIGDSLRAELVAAAREEGVAEPAGIVVILIQDRRTGVAEATSFQANVSDAAVAAAIARRAALLARWPERDGSLHVRLDGPFAPADAQVECMPAPLNGAAFSRELSRIFRDSRPVSAREQMSVRMLVSREGEVIFATVSRRGPGGTNQAVVEAARQLRFRPATVGGVPVDFWVEQPIVF